MCERNKKSCFLWFKFIDDDAAMGHSAILTLVVAAAAVLLLQ